MVEAPVVLVVAKEESLVNRLVQGLMANGIAAFGTRSLDDAVRSMVLLQPEVVVVDPTSEECFALLDDLSGGWRSIGLVAVVESDAGAQRAREMGIDEVIIGEDTGAVVDAVMELVQEKPASQVSGEGIRILVVDDEPELVDIMMNVLSRHGYTVLDAGDGKEALEVMEHEPGITLVLLDVMLPEMGGLETLKVLKQQYPSVSVILMSGVADAEIARHGRRLGAFDYVLKPINYEELENRIIAALAKGEFHHRSWWKWFRPNG